MTIRLTVSTEGAMLTLRIDGHLTRTDLPSVREVFASASAALRLDLSSLRSADADALRALESLSAEGAVLHGASPYVSELLRKQEERCDHEVFS